MQWLVVDVYKLRQAHSPLGEPKQPHTNNSLDKIVPMYVCMYDIVCVCVCVCVAIHVFLDHTIAHIIMLSSSTVYFSCI